MALQSIGNAIGNQAIKGMRMGAVKLAPVVAASTQVFLDAVDASRQFKRDAAIASENPLTEDEYQVLEDKQYKKSFGDMSDYTQLPEPRAVRVCCQTIRASREAFKTTGFDSPIALFSHWCLEIGGVFYELREYVPGKNSTAEKQQGKKILYQEIGVESRKIKLEVSTNGNRHPSATYYDVGTTTLDDDRIIWAASLIFGRFGSGYDLFIDNCQHFTQLLAEAICGRENREDVRKFFDKRSIMKLSVAASWLAAPVYGCTSALHHALEPSSSQYITEGAHQSVGKFLDNMENFYFHPRVYAARRRQNPFS